MQVHIDKNEPEGCDFLIIECSGVRAKGCDSCDVIAAHGPVEPRLTVRLESSIVIITTTALMFGSDIAVSKAFKSVDRVVVDVEAKFVDMAIKEDCRCAPGASYFKDRAGNLCRIRDLSAEKLEL